MSNFKAIKLNNEPYDFLIIATSVISPFENLFEVANEIDKDDARVIFDMTLINGLSTNRYISGEYKGGQFNMSKFSVLKNVNIEIHELSKCFFMENEEIVKKSVVSNPVKHLITRGLV